MKIICVMIACLACIGCAPSDQADSGDETFAPSNSTTGTVPDGIPGQGPASAQTDGETSTRGAVRAGDSPTSAQGSPGQTGAKTN